MAGDRGPGRPSGAGAAQLDHGRPRRPGRTRAGGQRRAHRGHGGRATVAAGAGGSGDDQRHGRADGQARDRGTGHDRDPRVPLRDARRGHGVPRRGHGLREGSGRRGDSRRRRVRRRRDGRLPDRGRSRCRAGARGAGLRGPGGQRWRGHRHDLLRLPGGHRDRLARGGRSSRRGPVALQLRRSPHLDLLEHGLEGAVPRGPDRGSCIAVCATDAPLSPLALRRLATRSLLGLARAGSYAGDGSGEIGLAFSASIAREAPPTRSSTPTSPPRTRPPASPSTTAWSPRGPLGAATARCRRGSPPWGGFSLRWAPQ